MTSKTPPSKKGHHTKISKQYLFELNTKAKHNLSFVLLIILAQGKVTSSTDRRKQARDMKFFLVIHEGYYDDGEEELFDILLLGFSEKILAFYLKIINNGKLC